MNERSRSGKVNLGNSALMPKEEHLETTVRSRRISIGIPSETKDDEKRVALTPEAVNLLVESDNEVVVQKGAGSGANYSDKDYSENGAIISESPARVYGSDVVIKVAPFTAKETEYLKGNQVVMSYLNVLKLNEETLAGLIRKKVTAIAFEKIRDSKLFNQGFATVEYLAASILDMAWHEMRESRPELDVDQFEARSMAGINLIQEIVPRYRSTYFNHIFSGGYSAGYYVYIWAEQLDADAFEAFKEKGLFDRATARSFRQNILEKYGALDLMTQYKVFRGAEPKIEPLLKRRGLMP